MKLWLKNIEFTDAFKVNKHLIMLIEFIAYAVIIATLYTTKQYFIPSLLIVPIVGASFYAGIIGGLSSCVVSVALLYLIYPDPANYLRIFVFLSVATHAGLTSDYLKKQIVKYQIQAEKLAIKTANLQEKNKTVNALREIDNSILINDPLQNTFEMIGTTLMHITNAKVVSVCIRKSPFGKPLCSGIPDNVPNICPGTVATDDAMKKKKPVIFQDYKKVLKDKEIIKFLDENNVNSILAVPMIIEDNAIGAMVLFFKHKTIISKKHIEDVYTFSNQATIAYQTQKLIENLSNISLETIESLVKAIEARDPYTAGHSTRVTIYAVNIAKKLGLNKEELTLMRYAALLHDIGKLGIDESIVNKPGQLTKEEVVEMRRHAALSDVIISPIKFLEPIRKWVYHHQEKFDGSGYPDGIKGNQIPLGARILAVADSYEAMTSDRPYRDAMNFDEAIGELKKCSGKHFDPKIVKTFLSTL